MLAMESNRVESALDRAKKQAGGPSGLSKSLGDISPQAISLWKRVPAERCLEVERITGISRHDLRPDVYGPATAEAQI